MATDGPIEPHSFDVIVLGTGLQEAMLAAAAASSRLSVLHLDPHEFYGAHWTSLDFKQFSSWAGAEGCFSVPSTTCPEESVSSSPAESVSSSPAESVSSSPAESVSVKDVVHDVAGSAGDLTGANFGDSSRGGTSNSESGDNLEHFVAESAEDGSLSAKKISDDETEAAALADRDKLEEVELESGKGLFLGLEISEYEGKSLGLSRSYSIDLCGPRLTFCGSNLVNLLIRSGASHYVEFKGVDASYIWTEAGLSAVPSSRADVFKDRSLSLSDKRFLMRFFKLVTDYATSEDQLSADVTAEDLDAPFLDFLQRQRLPASIQSYRAAPTGGHGLIILYAIALVDEDQERDAEDSGALVKTRDGLQKLALYLSSVSRFPNSSGAFLYPLYGQGELPQAFCRSAAVNGALYVLRRPVTSLLVDKDSKEYRGVRTLQGQVLYSKRLILGPSLLPTQGAGIDHSFANSDDRSKECRHSISSTSAATALPGERAGSQVARCVCITDRSLSEGQSTQLVIFPPRSVYKTASNAVRALQLSNSASVCPEDKYIVQLSTICTDGTDGRKALEAAVQALFAGPHDKDVENIEADSVSGLTDKPKLLWSVYYIQALQTNLKDLNITGVTCCKMPDGTLDGENMLTETERLFREMFPSENFFPQTAKPEDPVEDDDF